LDIWVNRQIVVEAKTIESLLPIHEAQLLTYMRLAQSRLGFLINFNSARLKDGIIRRII
jgi:GxxExxY protein